MTKIIISRALSEHNIYKYANVVGFSETLQLKVTKGATTDRECIKIYVTHKVNAIDLNDRDMIPTEINGICTDIEEVGEIRALSRTDNHRPLMAGISIGNKAITAGTPGWMYEKNGKEFLGSNAHVFCDDPSKITSTEKRILQRGFYDGGRAPDEVVGEYVWHNQIHPVNSDGSGCPVATGILAILNGGYSLLGRQTRFRSYVPQLNNQDFAVARLDEGVEFDLKTFDFDVIGEYDLTSLVFAGGPSASILCKVRYQLDAGYTPIDVDTATVNVGDTIRKSGRTSGDTKGTVRDTSVSIKVNYGGFTAVISDTILCTKFVDGGDSGSSAWRKKDD